MKKFIYIDRESAKKGETLVYAVSPKKIADYEERFENRAIEFVGGDIPHYITYLEETDNIRAATKIELVKRGDLILRDDEALIGDEIVFYNPITHKKTNNSIIEKSRSELIENGVITLESEKNRARTERGYQLAALDILDSKIAVGRVSITPEEKKQIDHWYLEWLELPNNYDNLERDISESYPETPEVIKYFMN